MNEFATKKPMHDRVAYLKASLMNQAMNKQVPTERIKRDLALNLLLNNISMVIGGDVTYFDIKPLGLGVYRVQTNMQKETRMISKKCA